MVPGKEVLSQLNQYFQEQFKVSLSANFIINEMRLDEVPPEISELIAQLDEFRKTDPAE